METQKTVDFICFLFLSILIVFGIVGNIVSLVIWNRGKQSKKYVCATYFKLVAFSDICVLVVPGTYELFRLYPVSYSITKYSDFVCKGVTFGRLFFPQISTWLLVVLTVERLLSIVFSLKYHLGNARRRAYIAASTILALGLMLTSPLLYGMGTKTFYRTIPAFNLSFNVSEQQIVTSTELSYTYKPANETSSKNDKGLLADSSYKGSEIHEKMDSFNRTDARVTNRTSVSCDFYNLSRVMERVAWEMNYVILLCILPLTLIVCCNFIILLRLCKNRKAMSNVSGRKDNVSAFTKFVVATGIIFTMSTVPMTLFVLTYLKHLNVTLIVNETNIFPEISRTLFSLNNGTNFLLYYISGETFRKDFKQMFTCVSSRQTPTKSA